MAHDAREARVRKRKTIQKASSNDSPLPFVVTAVLRGERVIVGWADEKGIPTLLTVCRDLRLLRPVVTAK